MSAGSMHLRAQTGEENSISAVELFFDLVYVFAVTQVSHLLIGNLTWAGAGRALFLLVVVWWAWIYTTWMVNWFDPESLAVRVVLLGATLASLLMAAALPEAFGAHGLLFAAGYVVLQVGRNVAAMLLLPRTEPLRPVFERIVAWSVASAPLWLAGALLDGDARLWLWVPALALDLAAPIAGYRTPGLGRSTTADWPVEGGHFAERFQGFLVIALGESIVVTGATAVTAGLTGSSVVALSVAFVGTATLWWLYFGEVAGNSRRRIVESEDPGALARDAYTYLHLPIVAGIILAAVGDELMILHPGEALTRAGALVVLGGPLLFLAGETLFRARMVRSVNRLRVGAMAVLVGLAAIATSVPALALGAVVNGVLVALALLEYRGTTRRVARAAFTSDSA